MDAKERKKLKRGSSVRKGTPITAVGKRKKDRKKRKAQETERKKQYQIKKYSASCGVLEKYVKCSLIGKKKKRLPFSITSIS